MNKKFDSQVAKADSLGIKKTPFVFFIDFLKNDFAIFTEEDLSKNPDVLVQIGTYKNFQPPKISAEKDFLFLPLPESFEDYQKRFQKISTAIESGKIDLINFTCKTRVESNLSLKEIFYRSKAKYKVFFRNEWVCFSPETFIEIKQGNIYTYPMKGTIDANLPDAKNTLLNDPKEKEEHQKSVDLLIHDLKKVAQNIQVSDFRRVDYLQTNRKNLYTTSSEIVGKILPEWEGKIGSILNRLLPAGSILGNPKEESLKIILESEDYSRGFYSGICGYFDGENLDSGVLIRFVENENGKLFFKSGGGITAKSNPRKEYEEVIHKIYVPIY